MIMAHFCNVDGRTAFMMFGMHIFGGLLRHSVIAREGKERDFGFCD